MKWIDPRLTFQPDIPKNISPNECAKNESCLDDMEQLTVHPEVLKQIWKPDLFFSNEKDAATHKIVMENALIRYDKVLLYFKMD